MCEAAWTARTCHSPYVSVHSFWVCEKSDGQRVLMLIVLNKSKGEQEVYLIDRRNHYRQQHQSLFFPYHEIPPSNSTLKRFEEMRIVGSQYGVRTDTLLDGELVWDVEPDGRVRVDREGSFGGHC